MNSRLKLSLHRTKEKKEDKCIQKVRVIRTWVTIRRTCNGGQNHLTKQNGKGSSRCSNSDRCRMGSCVQKGADVSGTGHTYQCTVGMFAVPLKDQTNVHVHLRMDNTSALSKTGN